MKNDRQSTSVIALGGLGEVGKNMYVVKHDDEIVIIDAGVMFPEDDLLGVDYVIQDVTYLKQNEDKIKALIITHGHEDHIGGIPFLLQSVKIPAIYASPIAKELILKKLNDRNIPYDNFETIDVNTTIKTKHFFVEFVATTHSIPESYAIAVHTPNGIVFHTGDFKFDLTPIGPMADLHKMAELGKKGVKILLADSTNALVPGFKLQTQEISTALGRGKHTTRETNLYPFLDGFIGDTPGFSKLDLQGILKEDLSQLFVEFRDCNHLENSKGCQILDKVSNNEILKTRYESYNKMYKEIIKK